MQTLNEPRSFKVDHIPLKCGPFVEAFFQQFHSLGPVQAKTIKVKRIKTFMRQVNIVMGLTKGDVCLTMKWKPKK